MPLRNVRYRNAWGASPSATSVSWDAFFNSFKHPLRVYTGGGAGSEHYGTNIIDMYRFDYPRRRLRFFSTPTVFHAVSVRLLSRAM